MGYGYGLELRTRIVESYENKEGSIREIAERFKVSPGTVQGYLNLKRSTGRLDPHPVSGGTAPILDPDRLEELRLLVDESPDATSDELADELARRQVAAVSRPASHSSLRLSPARARSC